MTEIALRDEQPTTAIEPFQQSTVSALEVWATEADNAVRYADAVVNTAMCPTAYRGKRDEAAAAILAGVELGFKPMASLRAFHSIQGTPTLKAETIRAIVQQAGHELIIVESTDQRCIVEGRRKGSDQWQRSEWTIDRAVKAGYTKKNPNWQSNPNAMLVARACTEVGRWIASDALMGVPVSEEIADQGVQVQIPTRRVSAADVVAAAVEHQEQMADSEQISRIQELFADLGMTTGAAKAELVASVIGHQVSGLHDLTTDEANLVIAGLHQMAVQP